MTKKKILSLFLALTMLLGMLPAASAIVLSNAHYYADSGYQQRICVKEFKDGSETMLLTLEEAQQSAADASIDPNPFSDMEGRALRWRITPLGDSGITPDKLFEPGAGVVLSQYAGNGDVRVSPVFGYEVTIDPANDIEEPYVEFVEGTGDVNYTLPAAPAEKDGYTFKSWLISGSGDGEFYPGEVKNIYENISITPYWEKKLTISFSSNGGSGEMDAVYLDTQTYYNFPECEFTAPEGKLFTGWTVSNALDAGLEEKVYLVGEGPYISTDVELVAQWGAACTVSFAANGGSGSMDAVEVGSGGAIIVPECGFTAPEGMYFDYWEYEYEGTPYSCYPNETIYITGNTTLTAVWSDYLTVVFKAVPGGEAKIGNNFKFLDNIVLPGPDSTGTAGLAIIKGKLGLDAGQEILGWYVLSSAEDYKGNTLEGTYVYPLGHSHWVTDSAVIVPALSTETVTLTIDSGDLGQPAKTLTLAKGASIILNYPTDYGFEAPAAETYDFRTWEYNGAEVGVGNSITVEESSTLTALWTPYVTVTYKANDSFEYDDAATLEMPTSALAGSSSRLPSSEVPLPTEVSGYKWIGYTSSDDNKVYPPEYLYTFTQAVTFTTAFVEEANIVNFHFDSGNEDYLLAIPATEVNWDKAQTYPIAEAMLYNKPDDVVFKGWEVYTDAEFANRFDDKLYQPGEEFIPVEGTADYYFKATWQQLYTVNFYGENIDTYVMGMTVAAGAAISLPDPGEYGGHIFLGWTLDGDESGKLYAVGEEYTPTQNSTGFTAQWKAVSDLYFSLNIHDKHPSADKVTVNLRLSDSEGAPITGGTYKLLNNAGEFVQDVSADENGVYSFEMPVSNGLTYVLKELEGGSNYHYECVVPEGYSADEYAGYGLSGEGQLYYSSSDVYLHLSYSYTYTVTYEPGDGGWADGAKPASKVFTYDSVNASDIYILWPGDVEGAGNGFSLAWYDNEGNALPNADHSYAFTNGQNTDGNGTEYPMGKNSAGKFFLGWKMRTVDLDGNVTEKEMSPHSMLRLEGDTTFTALWGDSLEDSYVTITVTPGYIYPEDAESSYDTSSLIPVTQDLNGNSYESYTYELLLGDYFTFDFPYTVPPAEDTAIVECNYRVIADGENVHSGGIHVNDNLLAGIAVEGMEIYPVYNYRLDLDLVNTGTAETRRISDFYSGQTLDVSGDEYYSVEEFNGQVHTGWYIDYNNDDKYQAEYGYTYESGSGNTYTGDFLVYDKFLGDQTTHSVNKAMVKDTNNTIKSLWVPGYVVEFRDVIEGGEGEDAQTFSHYEVRPDSADDHSITIEDAAACFGGMSGWNRVGKVFTGWDLTTANELQHPGTVYDNSDKESLEFTALWETAPYTLYISDGYDGSSYLGTNNNSVSVYLDASGSYEEHTFSAGLSDGELPVNEEGTAYSWYWTVAPMSNGVVDEEPGVATYKGDDYITAEQVRNCDSSYTEFRVTLNTYDPSSGIDSEYIVDEKGTVSIDVTFYDTQQSVNEFRLGIRDSYSGASYIGMAAENGNQTTVYADDTWSLTAYCYEGTIPNASSGEPYSWKWDIMPLVDGDVVPTPAGDGIVSAEIEGYDSLSKDNITGAIAGSYDSYRVSLRLYDPENPDNFSGIDHTGYWAQVDVTFSEENRPGEPVEAVVYLKAMVNGENVGFDRLFSKDEALVVTAETVPADENTTWYWEIIGQNNGYDNGYGENAGKDDYWWNSGDQAEGPAEIPLSEFLLMDPDETEWAITVYANEVYEPDSVTVKLKINTYDYSPSISAAWTDGSTIADPSMISFPSTSDNVVFSAAISPELSADEYSWSWDAYGNTTNTNAYFAEGSSDRLYTPTINIADFISQNTEETSWTLSVYAVDSNGEQISGEASVTINTHYAGDPYVKIMGEDSNTWVGMGNFFHAREWISYSGHLVGALPEGYDYPHWTLTPLDANGVALKDYSYVIIDSNSANWDGYVDEWEAGHSEASNGATPTSDGYATMSTGDDVDGGYSFTHPYWLLTLGAKNANGEVYDADNETGYMASVRIDNTNPFEIRIALDERYESYYVGTDNRYEANSHNEPFYQNRVGETGNSGDYNIPVWTATPLDAEGKDVTDENGNAVSFSVTPTDNEWDTHWSYDDYEKEVPGGYITGNMVYETAGSDYYAYSTWRLTLQAANGDGQVYSAEGVNDTAAVTVSFPVKYSVDFEETWTEGNQEGFNGVYQLNDKVQFSPSISPEYPGMTQWFVEYHNPDGWEGVETTMALDEAISLDTLREMNPEAFSWEITVWPADENGDRLDWNVYGILSLSMNPYPYTAELSVYEAYGKEGQTLIEDTDNYPFTAESDISLIPALVEEDVSVAAWQWNIYGEDNDKYFRVTQDTLTMAEIFALDNTETTWGIQVYAVDDEGDRISSSERLSLSIPYAGPFMVYVTDDYGSTFKAGVNRTIDTELSNFYYPHIKGVPSEAFADNYPYFTLTPVNEDGSVKDGCYTMEIIPNTEGTLWEGWIASGEYASVFEAFGIDGSSHRYWQLTMGVKNTAEAVTDASTQVYDANNETGYMVTINIDSGNPLRTFVYDDVNYGYYYAGAPVTIEATVSTWFYQNLAGTSVEGYDQPLWTAQPLNDNLQPVEGLSAVVIPTGSLWGDESDETAGDYLDAPAIRDAVSEEYKAYSSWRLTLAAANSDNEPYPGSETIITVTFTDWVVEEPESPYSIKITDTDNGVVFEDMDTVVKHVTAERALNLKAELYENGELYEGDILYSWRIMPSTGSGEINETFYGQISEFGTLFSDNSNIDLWLVHVSAHIDNDNSGDASEGDDLLHYINTYVRFTDDVVILSPSDEQEVFSYAGEEVTLSVAAVNAGSYQWQYRQYEDHFANIEGANTDTLTLSNISYEQFGDYRCLVTGTVGGVETTLPENTEDGFPVWHYTVRVLPRITSPETVAIENGQAVLSAEVLPEADGYSYIWKILDGESFVQVGESNISEPVLTVTDPVAGSVYQLDVFYNNRFIGSSDNITLVDAEPEAPVVTLSVIKDGQNTGALVSGSTFAPTDNVSFEASISPALENVVWKWDIYGGGFDNGKEDKFPAEDADKWWNEEDIAAAPNPVTLADLAEMCVADYLNVCVYAYDANDYLLASSETYTINIQETGTEIEPDPEPQPQILISIGGKTYENGDTADLVAGQDYTVSAEAAGSIAGYAVSIAIDGETSGEAAPVVNFAEVGSTHTLVVTAVNSVSTFALTEGEDGSYTATVTLNVVEAASAPESGHVDVDPSDENDANNPTNINVTGILMDDVTVVNNPVYSVEIVWGDMAFVYHKTSSQPDKVWNPTLHEWEQTGTGTTTSAVWELNTAGALELGDGSAIFPNTDQSHAVVFNHSNAPVNVKMTITSEQAAGNVAISLSSVSGGVTGTAHTSGTGLDYALPAGVVDKVYDSTTGAAAKVSLSNEPTGLSETQATKLARLDIVISKPSA